MSYVAIIGNNATESTNRTLIQHLVDHVAEAGSIRVFEIRPLPAFRPSEDRTAPPQVQELIDAIAASDGVIIATPEYDHSIPAALKSALEWLSWSSEVMKGRPVMIMGASYGRLGTSRAQDHLRQILTSPWLRASVLPAEFLLGGSMQAFDDAGKLVDPSDAARLDAHFAEFQAFSKVIQETTAKGIVA